MQAPPHPSRVRELRLVVRREPFGHPARLIHVREQPRGAPEHTLQPVPQPARAVERSEEHTSELQSHSDLVCRLLLEKKKTTSQHVQNLVKWQVSAEHL